MFPGLPSYCNSLAIDVTYLLCKKSPFKCQLKTLFGQQSACHHCLSNIQSVSLYQIQLLVATMGPTSVRKYLQLSSVLSQVLTLVLGNLWLHVIRCLPSKGKNRPMGIDSSWFSRAVPALEYLLKHIRKCFKKSLVFLLDNSLTSHLSNGTE